MKKKSREPQLLPNSGKTTSEEWQQKMSEARAVLKRYEEARQSRNEADNEQKIIFGAPEPPPLPAHLLKPFQPSPTFRPPRPLQEVMAELGILSEWDKDPREEDEDDQNNNSEYGGEATPNDDPFASTSSQRGGPAPMQPQSVHHELIVEIYYRLLMSRDYFHVLDELEIPRSMKFCITAEIYQRYKSMFSVGFTRKGLIVKPLLDIGGELDSDSDSD
ncbi:hypothetical protein QR680_004181 [Steinernema hermaphroditum]|uniref:Uncharacterized protein n=1 Tax=Steinernema hermaphroditum TaxID=289476 RepID=A0AA39HPA9_9BILA|nr:hypothetical protein QR680_004181 [Steinernema hermaphroditum]